MTSPTQLSPLSVADMLRAGQFHAAVERMQSLVRLGDPTEPVDVDAIRTVRGEQGASAVSSSTGAVPCGRAGGREYAMSEKRKKGTCTSCGAETTRTRYRLCGECRNAELAARARRSDEPVVGDRTLLAKTCFACGELRMADRFDLNKGYRQSKCRRCRFNKHWEQLPEERRKAKQVRNYLAFQRSNLPGSRHGQQWTGPELEIAARRDLSTHQAAEMLGRTRAAVQNKRSLLDKGDPKTVWLAGVSEVIS